MTMKLRISLTVLCCAAGPALAGGPALEKLPALRDFEMRRITSADPTGRNKDWRLLPPGKTLVLADVRGPGCIVHFRDNITSREPHHLQMHVLRMFWDGEASPSVEVPFGDFFAVGFGFTAKFSSALMNIDRDRGKGTTDPSAYGAARNCYIPMPFARSARITVTNEGTQPSRHWYEVNYKAYAKPPAGVGYFHAQYRQGTPPPEGPYLILDAKGRGHLIGCVLSIKNNDGGWWGEGDEIVHIDGKHAIQGTGSEDYFCESYGLAAGCFPYYGVTLCKTPYTTAYRWHVVDPVPFRKSIRFLIETGRGNPPFKTGNYYYSVAYWYQTEPHAAFGKLPSVAERINWARRAGVEGAIEGETARIVRKTGGLTEIQSDFRWSGGKQLWWRDGKPGDKLELVLPVAKTGRYRIVMHNTRAFDYGIFAFHLDGEKLAGPIDLYSKKNITKLVELGTRELDKGARRLVVEIVGANPKAEPRHMLGLDYLMLQEAR